MADPLCPVCAKRPPDAKLRPFCSRRCADIDLGRWLGGRYVVEGQDSSAPANSQEPDPED